MSKVTFKAETTLVSKTQVTAKARNHQVTIDEPAELGGDDNGMNPVELVLSSLGACYIIVMQTYAKRHDVAYDELSVDVEGDLDPAGFMGDASVDPGFSEIRYRVNIVSGETPEKIDEFLKVVQSFCPVNDILKRAIPVAALPPKITPRPQVA